MRRMMSVALVMFIGLSVSCPVVHAATAPVALVLETSGTIVPDIHPYTEAPAGTSLVLRDHATLVFQHYKTCETVTVAGGAITFTEQSYDVKGGTKKTLKKGLCPRHVRLKAGGSTEIGGIFFRSPKKHSPGGSAASPSKLIDLTAAPTFVLVGRRAGDYASARISQGETVVLEAPLNGRRFDWPADASPLVLGTEYVLALLPTSGEGGAVTLRFKPAESAPGSPAEALVVLTVD